jgi:hypothetical protein
MSRLSRQCGIRNISQPYRPPRPVTGIALLYFTMNTSLASVSEILLLPTSKHSLVCVALVVTRPRSCLTLHYALAADRKGRPECLPNSTAGSASVHGFSELTAADSLGWSLCHRGRDHLQLWSSPATKFSFSFSHQILYLSSYWERDRTVVIEWLAFFPFPPPNSLRFPSKFFNSIIQDIPCLAKIVNKFPALMEP